MRFFRRYCALAMSGLIIGGVLTGVAASAVTATPAAADTPEVFAGSASATAFNLNLLNLVKLTMSPTHASVDSTPKAHADAAVATGSLGVSPTSADAPVGANLSFTSPQPCATSVPVQSILLITGGCSQSAAAVPNAPAPTVCAPTSGVVAPAACASASLLNIDVQLLQALQPLLDALKNTVQGLSTQVGTVLSNIPVVSPLLNNLLHGPLLGGLNISLSDPVSSLITALERATELLSIRILPSDSAVATAPGAVVAASEADGVVLTVLPGLTVAGNPLLQVILAKGATVSTYNRITCQTTSTFTAAGVQIKLLDNPVQNLGLGTITLPLGLGTIIVGGGATTQNADGSVGSVADGLNVNLLGGLVQLGSGHAESVAGGKCATLTAVASTVAPTTTTLPAVTGTLAARLATTGSDTPFLPIGVGLLLMGLVTRRTLVKRRAGRKVR
jgi:hypothetical protein